MHCLMTVRKSLWETDLHVCWFCPVKLKPTKLSSLSLCSTFTYNFSVLCQRCKLVPYPPIINLYQPDRWLSSELSLGYHGLINTKGRLCCVPVTFSFRPEMNQQDSQGRSCWDIQKWILPLTLAMNRFVMWGRVVTWLVVNSHSWGSQFDLSVRLWIIFVCWWLVGFNISMLIWNTLFILVNEMDLGQCHEFLTASLIAEPSLLSCQSPFMCRMLWYMPLQLWCVLVMQPS